MQNPLPSDYRRIPSNHCYPCNRQNRGKETANGKESGWRKIEKAAITLYRESAELNEVKAHADSLYSAVPYLFIFNLPEFSFHLQLCYAER